MDWLEDRLVKDLPEGWEVVVERGEQEVTVQCQHVVLGGHEFHLTLDEEDDPGEVASDQTAGILQRLEELGLLEASRTMPTLTDAEEETLREAHAVIGAARLSKRQAHSVIGLSLSLARISDNVTDWAFATIELLEPWHDYPADPHARTEG